MRKIGGIEPAEIFDDERARRVAVLVGGDRIEKVASIGQTIGADRPAFGQGQILAVVFANIAACRPVDEIDAPGLRT